MVGVGGLIKQDDSVLLVKRENEPGRGKWSIPGGLINLGETMKNAVKREVEEEAGLRVDVEVLDVFDAIIYDDKSRVRFHYVIVSFMAKLLGGEIRGSERGLTS
jgi:ADP-ribose pyrophosphatase YjhB (NUDIX family)